MDKLRIVHVIKSFMDILPGTDRGDIESVGWPQKTAGQAGLPTCPAKADNSRIWPWGRHIIAYGMSHRQSASGLRLR